MPYEMPCADTSLGVVVASAQQEHGAFAARCLTKRSPRPHTRARDGIYARSLARCVTDAAMSHKGLRIDRPARRRAEISYSKGPCTPTVHSVHGHPVLEASGSEEHRETSSMHSRTCGAGHGIAAATHLRLNMTELHCWAWTTCIPWETIAKQMAIVLKAFEGEEHDRLKIARKSTRALKAFNCPLFSSFGDGNGSGELRGRPGEARK
ncbi:hypothetical protein FB451DRAFT_1180785 [Mycena latifolia]|nr:hypothetical protein FB451DRAFT_1180785 [Mycena latifolia]